MPQTNDRLLYHLNDTTPLRSHFRKSGEFDSLLEADFAAEFEAKFGGERGNWVLTREDEVLLLGDTVMIPDFAATHKKDGRRALIEIVGFWHPDYLRRKVMKLRQAKRKNLILLVYEGVNLTPDRLKDVPGEVLYFPNKPVVKDVMAAIERVAEQEHKDVRLNAP
jgi:predicted nuclease of restriction endonuclease-like RecB superfamily